MVCLPRSDCIGSRCLTHITWIYWSLGNVGVLELSKCRFVPPKRNLLDAMTIHFEIWPLALRSSTVPGDSSQCLNNYVFDLGVMEPLCFGYVDQRVLIGMITKPSRLCVIARSEDGMALTIHKLVSGYHRGCFVSCADEAPIVIHLVCRTGPDGGRFSPMVLSKDLFKPTI
ncbi:hypothetical protein Tco_0690606 [Tanacetum coccineum]